MTCPTFDPSRIPESEAWRREWANPTFGAWDYVHFRASLDLLAVFAQLFWPEFTEIDDCVILTEKYDPSTYLQWVEHLSGDRQRVESILNHTHVYDLFSKVTDVPCDLEIAEYVGRVLQRSWECALRNAFPERSFVVEFWTEPDEYGPTVTFYQSPAEAGGLRE